MTDKQNVVSLGRGEGGGVLAFCFSGQIKFPTVQAQNKQFKKDNSQILYLFISGIWTELATSLEMLSPSNQERGSSSQASPIRGSRLSWPQPGRPWSWPGGKLPIDTEVGN